MFGSMFQSGFGIFLGFLIWTGAMIYVGGFLRKGRKAKQNIEAILKKVDIERLLELDKEFKQKNEAKTLLENAKLIVSNFFGESHLLPF